MRFHQQPSLLLTSIHISDIEYYPNQVLSAASPNAQFWNRNFSTIFQSQCPLRSPLKMTLLCRNEQKPESHEDERLSISSSSLLLSSPSPTTNHLFPKPLIPHKIECSKFVFPGTYSPFFISLPFGLLWYRREGRWSLELQVLSSDKSVIIMSLEEERVSFSVSSVAARWTEANLCLEFHHKPKIIG